MKQLNKIKFSSLIIMALVLIHTYSCKKENKSSSTTAPTTTPTQFNTNLTYSTMSDIDGNVYKTITIGNQTWMAENLKTTKYNDGTDIANVTGDTEWSSLTTPAYCWYNNNANTYKATYGALYNWYAVNTGVLAPMGWHVPTTTEWNTLVNYLIANGYNYDGTVTEDKIAKSLASALGWRANTETGGVGNTDYPTYINKSGFSAMPSGYRNDNCQSVSIAIGAFGDIGGNTSFWSSTGYSFYAGHIIIVDGFSFTHGGSSYGDFGLGYSVRCVKN